MEDVTLTKEAYLAEHQKYKAFRHSAMLFRLMLQYGENKQDIRITEQFLKSCRYYEKLEKYSKEKLMFMDDQMESDSELKKELDATSKPCREIEYLGQIKAILLRTLKNTKNGKS